MYMSCSANHVLTSCSYPRQYYLIHLLQSCKCQPMLCSCLSIKIATTAAHFIDSTVTTIIHWKGLDLWSHYAVKQPSTSTKKSASSGQGTHYQLAWFTSAPECVPSTQPVCERHPPDHYMFSNELVRTQDPKGLCSKRNNQHCVLV